MTIYPTPGNTLVRRFQSGRTDRIKNMTQALCWLLCAVALVTSAAAQTTTSDPNPNGLFYGDGDNNRYPSTPYAVSETVNGGGGSKVYLRLEGTVLHVALVVDRSVNDTVIADVRGADGNIGDAYLQSAGWRGRNNESALRRMDSEYAEFTLTVG